MGGTDKFIHSKT